jgi:hypothetical protein
MKNILYIVQPTGIHYRHYTKDLRGDNRLYVNNTNLKVGRADDAARRICDYDKTFDGEFEFTPIISCDSKEDLKLVESQIKKALKAHRCQATGSKRAGLTEWLKDIHFEDLKEIILSEHKDFYSKK